MMFSVIISSAGRRSHLLRLFRESLTARGIDGKIIAIDASPWSAASKMADVWYQVPLCSDLQFLPEVRRICERESVGLVVPTIDTELPIFAEHSGDFATEGITINISTPDIIALCDDKLRTNRFLQEQGIPCNRQFEFKEVLAGEADPLFPAFIKPRYGSASHGAYKVNDMDEMRFLANRVQDPVMEEFNPGKEYTVNCYVDGGGRLRCAVPHFRVETRGGEVSKGLTVKDPRLMNLAVKISEGLKGIRGAFCFQCFLDNEKDNKLAVSEINARFGGGYPLAHAAGADFPGWLIDEAMGNAPDFPSDIDQWEDGLAMTRWDDAVFFRPVELKD